MGKVVCFDLRHHARASTEAAALMPKIAGSHGSSAAPERTKKYSPGILPRIFQLETTRGSTPAISDVAVVPPKAETRSSTDAIMILTNPRCVELSRLHGTAVENPQFHEFNRWMDGFSRDATAFRLQVLREALGKSQEDIGAPVDCHPKRWSNYESLNQKRKLDIAIAAKISDRYGVTLDWIYRGIMRGVDEELRPLLDAAEKKLLAARAGGAEPRRVRHRTAVRVGKGRRKANH